MSGVDMFSPLRHTIKVREYRRGNHKGTILRNWQRRVHKTKKNTAKTQRGFCRKNKLNNRCVGRGVNWSILG